MLLTLGYVLAGVILYEVLMKDDSPSRLQLGSRCEHMTSSDTSFKVKEEVGSLRLPSCNLVAVQLGPSEDKKKAVLTLYLENKTSPHETFKPVSDLRTKKYVKLSPAYYATGIHARVEGWCSHYRILQLSFVTYWRVKKLISLRAQARQVFCCTRVSPR